MGTPVRNKEFSVVAIIAAYNEGDIIEQVVRHLIEQGVNVYLLDHCSTDDTVAQVRPYLGRGVLHIERFPDESGGPPEDARWFVLEKILKRKEVLAQELEATWFINSDADEFRESPFGHLNLREAVRAVDHLGYNAIDFEVFDFWPSHNDFHQGVDVRDAFRYYARGDTWNKIQVRCWKKTVGLVDLASTGGHNVAFADQRVFPIRFILRHYPIRSEAHGRRKVFQERLPRFAEAERRRPEPWHVQYDVIAKEERFLREPSSMIPYDPEAVRLHLLLNHRGVEEAAQHLTVTVEAHEGLNKKFEEAKLEAHRQLAEAKLEADRRAQEAAQRLRLTLEALERLNKKFEEAKLEADRRLAEAKLEGDRRLAEAQLEGDRRLAEAQLEADRRLAEVKLEGDRGVEEAKLEGDRGVEEAKLEGDRRVEEAKLEGDRRVEEARLERDQSNEELERLKKKGEEVNEELERLRRQMSVVLISRSWRLTAPIRGVARLLRRLS
jgi:Glycosyl transferase family 2